MARHKKMKPGECRKLKNGACMCWAKNAKRPKIKRCK